MENENHDVYSLNAFAQRYAEAIKNIPKPKQLTPQEQFEAILVTLRSFNKSDINCPHCRHQGSLIWSCCQHEL